MNFHPYIASKNPLTASALVLNRKHSELLLFIILLISMLCLIPILVLGGITIGVSLLIAIVAVILISALVLRWPLAGFFAVLACTLLIEQDPLPVPIGLPDIYVFSWPSSLQGLPDRPIGFLMLFVLLVFICHTLLKRQKSFSTGVLFLPFVCFLLCVAWGVIHGLSTGGDPKIIVNEVRSFWYLFLGYLLAYNLVQSKKHLRSFFWFVIICAGLKALEGVYIYIVVIHGDLASHREIMAHEESYFWVSILLLIVLFRLHYKYQPQFYLALAILPFLLIALIANNRRADFIALLAGLAVAWALMFIIKRESRKLLVTLLLITLLLGGAYVAAFYKGQGGFSEPARAIVSVFHPDPTDASSNLYRDIEDADLKYTVKLNPLGFGFGKPFLQPTPLPDISADDPVYNYIPHNTIYWVWMRLGAPGYLALWYLFGAIIVRGCIYARRLKDTYLQLIAIYIVSMIVMEIIVAFADYQLSFYRSVIYAGMLAGILMKLPSLDRQEEHAINEPARTHAKLPLAHMGRWHS